MNSIKEAVQQKYGEAALNARSGAAKAGCGCGTSCGPDPITSNLYDDTQAAGVPAEALLASLGCGNPTALAELKAGEVVLDLGSGGGLHPSCSSSASTRWRISSRISRTRAMACPWDPPAANRRASDQERPDTDRRTPS